MLCSTLSTIFPWPCTSWLPFSNAAKRFHEEKFISWKSNWIDRLKHFHVQTGGIFRKTSKSKSLQKYNCTYFFLRTILINKSINYLWFNLIYLTHILLTSQILSTQICFATRFLQFMRPYGTWKIAWFPWKFYL